MIENSLEVNVMDETVTKIQNKANFKIVLEESIPFKTLSIKLNGAHLRKVGILNKEKERNNNLGRKIVKKIQHLPFAGQVPETDPKHEMEEKIPLVVTPDQGKGDKTEEEGEEMEDKNSRLSIR